MGAIVDTGAARTHPVAGGAGRAGRLRSCGSRSVRRMPEQGGCFYPPTLVTNVAPASTLAQEEIFGPVLVTMSFRTPEEAVALANNSRYGLAASVWSENISRALDIAPKLKAGVVWINCDQSVRCGGRLRRISRIGLWPRRRTRGDLRISEGGLDGGWKIEDESNGRTRRRPQSNRRNRRCSIHPPSLPPSTAPPSSSSAASKRGRTAATRFPSSNANGARGRSRRGQSKRHSQRRRGCAQRGGRRGRAAPGTIAHRFLYYIGENLSARAAEFASRLRELTGRDGKAEVEATIARLFTYAAWADKWDGQVHQTPIRGVTLAMNEPFGVIGVAAPDEYPLLGFISTIAPAIAGGNTVVAIPSERHPLAVTDFYQVLETSDVPAGVVNIVTGRRDELAKVLAEHDDVDAIWYFGGTDGVKACETASTGNMKQTWCESLARDWNTTEQGEGREFMRRATQVKNIWIPYGE